MAGDKCAKYMAYFKHEDLPQSSVITRMDSLDDKMGCGGAMLGDEWADWQATDHAATSIRHVISKLLLLSWNLKGVNPNV